MYEVSASNEHAHSACKSFWACSCSISDILRASHRYVGNSYGNSIINLYANQANLQVL